MIATAIGWLMRAGTIFVAACVIIGGVGWVGSHPHKAAGAVENVWDWGTDTVSGWLDFGADVANG